MSITNRFLLIGAIVLIAAYVAFFPFVADTGFARLPVISSLVPPPYKLGMDLKGGTVLTFRVRNGSEKVLEELSAALKRRLDPTGVKGYSIRGFGTEFIRITIPDVEAGDQEIEQVKRLVTTVGELEFRIIADRRNSEHAELIEEARLSWPAKRFNKGFFVPYGKWIPVSKEDPDKDLLERAAKATEPKIEENVWFRPLDSFTEESRRIGDAIEFRSFDPNTRQYVERAVVSRIFDGEEMVLARWTDNEDGDDRPDFVFGPDNLTVQGSLEGVEDPNDNGDHYVLVFEDDHNVTGKYLIDAYPDMQNGQRCLIFRFDSEGARRFGDLTTEFQPEGQREYQLGVILDGRLRSAPGLQEPITHGSGRITGSFSAEEIDRLERVFRAGRLSGDIDPNPDEKATGPSLGEATIRSGIISMAFALAGVIVFIVLYYRVAGAVAILALGLNVLLTVAGLVLIGQNWTLVALAALVLTIGMSVDSNVLIFERIREELDLGRPLLMAMRSGYEKAWGTILDSNLTTILTGVILFAVGSEEMKGFAVTLIIGLLCSMFTAVFVTRTVFQALYNARILRKMSMARILSNPNFHFVKWARPAIVASLILIAVGMVGVGARGKQLFGTDLVGGTDAALRFKEPTDIERVRKLADSVVVDPTVQELTIENAAPSTRFIIQTETVDTADTPPEDTVRARLKKAFEGMLEVQSVAPGETTDLPANADEIADAREKPFAGGRRISLSVSPPRKLYDLQLELVNGIRESMADVENPQDLFALLPPPLPEGTSREQWESNTVHEQFFLVSKQDLRGVVERISGEPLFDQYGGTPAAMARDAQVWAITAVVLSWFGIIAYVWFRFGSWTFGVGGVAALVHDVLVALSMLALVSILAVSVPAVNAIQLTEMRIDLNVIASLLTLIGFSINDTIVIFDRIRELRGKSPRLSGELVDRALNGTLSRTIITSLTVFFTVFVLFLFGGAGIHAFAFVLVVGVLSGTYSTIYISCPVVLWLEEWKAKRSKRPIAAEPQVTATAP